MNRPSSVILGETRPRDLDNRADNRGMKMAVSMDTELTDKPTGNYCSWETHFTRITETS